MKPLAVEYNRLGRRYHESGRLAEAAVAFERAIALDPSEPESFNNLGIIRHQQRDHLTAGRLFMEAMRLAPTFPGSYANFAAICDDAGRPSETVAFYQRAIQLDPSNWAARHNMAKSLRQLGRWPEAYAALEEVIAMAPDDPDVHGGLIYTRDGDPTSTKEQRAAERSRWHAKHAKQAAVEWTNEPDPERKIRIGYVSADFYHHSASIAFGPLLVGHDPGRFHVTCYANNTIEDASTDRFRMSVEQWRPICGLSDWRVAEIIKADAIDILVDLSGHTAGNRLPLFTLKPAPVSVSALGYAIGSGIPVIDYVLTDPILSGHEYFAETPLEVPCLLTYDASEAPDIVPLPALSNGYVTFGYMGRWVKASADTIALWRDLMAAMPTAKLFLKDRCFADPGITADTVDRLEIEPDRLIAAGNTSHWRHLLAHNEVDLILDPLWINGGVTSLEAMWMGVPVLTKPCGGVAGHVGESLMRTLGLPQFVAGDYVETAKRVSQDIQALASIRAGMRGRMRATTIGNTALYVAHVERAYREIWKTYCKGKQPC